MSSSSSSKERGTISSFSNPNSSTGSGISTGGSGAPPGKLSIFCSLEVVTAPEGVVKGVP